MERFSTRRQECPTFTYLRLQQANGAIIGGVPVAEPIPEYWNRACPSHLFYEQAFQPSPLVLETV